MQQIIASGKKTVEIEARAIEDLIIDEQFAGAVKAVLNCKGKLIVCGMGKSGLIGQKIAATLASTGTPSFFLHPAEAYHGDLGMIAKEDALLLLSNSGETDEVLKIIPFLHDQGNIVVAITGNALSTLAKAATFHLNVAVKEEACPWQLAPTSSTTAALVMGDALAVALMSERNFKPEEFARFHPGGSLGRKLLTKVSHEMIKSVPTVTKECAVLETIHKISAGRLGMVVVVDSKEKLVGIVTDGDIRRALESKKEALFGLNASDIMSANPRTIRSDVRLIEAEEIMDKLNIHQLVVVDESGKVAGILPYRTALK